MKLPFAVPDPVGTERAQSAKNFRDLATEISRTRPHALTRSNGEEADHGPKYPANFTKGLLHDENGLVEHPEDYRSFVEAINSPDRNLFEAHVQSAVDRTPGTTPEEDLFKCKVDGEAPKWRGWESPRSGHVYELEGPDAGSVGMAPAPRVGSSELSAEMAEVYGLALLRDVPFTTICEGGGDRLCASDKEPGPAQLTAKQIVHLLNQMPFYSGKYPVSSTHGFVDTSGLNHFERNRRFARTLSDKGQLTPATAFRGSTRGAHAGPYISQFMLIGGTSLAGGVDGKPSFPGRNAAFDLQDGFIPYGSQSVDQRTLHHKNCLDYMTTWTSWLDVQNGANLKGADQFEKSRRFITTPRDLATYVHFDALYQAYLNACLILLGSGTPHSKGFPEPSPSGKRDAFATFGGPHILSLVTEVATRCLKAVRRQKFNYHRRARPEVMGGRLTLSAAGHGEKLVGKACAAEANNARVAFEDMLHEMPKDLLEAIAKHNAEQNTQDMRDMRRVQCPDDHKKHYSPNLLLPMAFPEGSPMHPAYGAGHATVAGGCVTMLKAFFEMYDSCDSGRERLLLDSQGEPIVYVPNSDGSRLRKDRKFKGALTIQGELDKLAANISIGRNMAGVHYYSDYYDSLRMGERIAVGILLEQAPTYGDTVETTFQSFDGDFITISGEAGAAPSLSVIDRDGTPVSPQGWWLRHVSGEESVLDL